VGDEEAPADVDGPGVPRLALGMPWMLPRMPRAGLLFAAVAFALVPFSTASLSPFLKLILSV